jgi:Flp pilus assembly pilin Flp
MRPRHLGAERSYAQPKFSTKKGEDMRTLARLWKEEEGQDLIEYVLLVALIALLGLAGFPTLGADIAAKFKAADTCLTSQAGC